jgi:hypothetical protein
VVYVGTSTSFVDTGLTGGTTYRYRIYTFDKAYNYSTAVTTSGTPSSAVVAPTVTSSAATSVAATGATLNGDVTADGGASLTERGFYTKTSSGVTTSDTKQLASGTTTGAYTLAVTNLSVNTRYYFKSYASNSAGTSLSSTEQDFWTLANAPSAPTLSSATATGMSVAIGSGDGNPATTQYAIQTTSGSQYVQADGTLGASAVWQTAATWGTRSVSGLTSSTSYTWQVKARNGANTETAFGSTASLSTSSASSPVLTAATLGSALTATYPSASSGVSFTATGSNLTAENITATAQSGYQVSTDNSTYSSSVSVAAGTTVYVRLAANTSAGTYNSATAVVLSGGGAASSVNVTTSSSGNTISKGTQAAVSGSLNTSTINFGQTATLTASGGSGSGAYEFRQNGGTGLVTFSGTGASRTVSVTTAGTAILEVRRLADANYNDSSWAAAGTLIVNQASQAITFGSLAAKTFGDAAFNPGATASSGLTVTYASSDINVATVAGSTVTIVGAGTTTITASQAGDANYNAASSVPQSLTVNQASQTITFNLATNTVAAGTTNALTATSSVAGMTVSYTSANTAVATISGTNVIAVAPGVTTITASQAGNANVTAATPVSRTLNVANGSTTNAFTSTTVAGWDFSTNPGGVNNYGPSPMAPTTNVTGVSVVGLSRGSTLQTTNSGAASAWGANTWGAFTNAADSASNQKFASFSITVSSGYLLNLTNVGAYNVRRSSSGPATGIWQWSTNGSDFTDIGSAITWGGITSSAGNAQTNIPLNGIGQLQGLAPGTTVTFRILNWGATGEAGTWYLNTSSGGTGTALDFVVEGQLATVSAGGGSPVITPSGSFAAVSTTYGAASAASATTVTVTGGSLTADITATAPTGFQVSSDGTTWGSTATFTQTDGFANGTLYLRLAANAAAGAYNDQVVTLSSTGASNQTVAIANSTVSPASLASNQITLTPGAGSAYTASGPAGSTFTIGYAGRTANGIATSYSSSTAPTAAGYYTVTATSTGNYSGSNSTNTFVAGPVAGNDAITKPADNSRIKIPTTTLLANDSRIHSDGSALTDNLAITAVSQGTGTAASSISGAFVLFTPSSAGSDSFTYTVTDSSSGLTATGTVTVTTEAAAPTFTLQIVAQGTATFDGTNTSIAVDFIGVPNLNYVVEYKGELGESSWTSAGTQSSGATGSFTVTITKAGDHTADWNGSMFFRASR